MACTNSSCGGSAPATSIAQMCASLHTYLLTTLTTVTACRCRRERGTSARGPQVLMRHKHVQLADYPEAAYTPKMQQTGT